MQHVMMIIGAYARTHTLNVTNGPDAANTIVNAQRTNENLKEQYNKPLRQILKPWRNMAKSKPLHRRRDECRTTKFALRNTHCRSTNHYLVWRHLFFGGIHLRHHNSVGPISHVECVCACVCTDDHHQGLS